MKKTNSIFRLRASKKSKLISRAFVALLILSIGFVSYLPDRSSSAASIKELQQKSQKLQAEIAANKKKAAHHHAHASTLQGRISELNEEIETANKEINLLTIQVKALQLQIDEATVELEKQRDILGQNIKAMYLEGEISTLEMLATSKDLSEFVDKEQYRTSVQDKIKTTLDKINKLRIELKEKKDQIQELLDRQQKQRDVLASKRTEQKKLLEETRGEEARFKRLAAAQQKQLEAAEAELSRQLSSGRFVSYGRVYRGNVVGAVGNTGYSFGAHLHFMVKHNGTPQNPGNNCNNLINGYSCPLPGSRVTTPFGNIHCSDYVGAPGCDYYVFHSGLDLAGGYQDSVLAAADGNIIFRGCQGALGYVVVIDHGGGWQTWYPHMVTPSGQVSGYC